MPYPYYNNIQPTFQQTFPQYQQPVMQTVQPIPTMGNFQNGNGSPIPNTPAVPNIPQTQTIQPTMQMQNGGFIHIPNINEALNYPVAPGNVVTFKDDSAPYIYEKSMGFSQLERPVFKRYRLTEETAEQEPPVQAPQNAQSGGISASPVLDTDLSEYVKNTEFDALRAKFGDISAVIESITATVDKLRFDVDAISDKSTKKLVQKARKEADEE